MIQSRLLSLFLGIWFGCLGLSGCTPAKFGEDQLEEQVLQVIRDHPEVILESVQAYQKRQEEQVQASRQQFLEKMTTNPGSIVGESPTLGSAEKNLILLEFSDYQCPFCAQAHPTLKQFIAKHQNTVTLVYKHLPLSAIHPEAIPAAKAAWAAQQQGQFWAYHDALFERQKDLGESLYPAIAQELGLDLEQFNRDRQSGKAERAIAQDFELAEELGINSTPVFFMNEELIPAPLNLNTLEAVLKKVQASAKAQQ